MKNIAVVAGGYSGEYEVSINSLKTICNCLDKSKYIFYKIIITKDKWVFIDEKDREHPVDKNDFSVNINNKKTTFDCVLITIHGSPGEDGKLQGYFDLLNIPYTTAGLLASALTFNKHYCNLLVSKLGVKVANSIKYHISEKIEISDILKRIKLPVFVKPNSGGSSLGTTFVNDKNKLSDAIKETFKHDKEAFIEEFIDGTELTCGAYTHNKEVIALPITEIISKTKANFFDYEAKYTKGAADEITPARISSTLTKEIQDLTVKLYKELNLRGIVRFDYIHNEEGLFFLETNITPGMAETSIVPQQAEVVGISITDLYTIAIEESLSNKY